MLLVCNTPSLLPFHSFIYLCAFWSLTAEMETPGGNKLTYLDYFELMKNTVQVHKEKYKYKYKKISEHSLRNDAFISCVHNSFNMMPSTCYHSYLLIYYRGIKEDEWHLQEEKIPCLKVVQFIQYIFRCASLPCQLKNKWDYYQKEFENWLGLETKNLLPCLTVHINQRQFRQTALFHLWYG